MDLIDREIQRLTAIVKKMYTLYQGLPATERQATDIAELLQDVATLLEHKMAVKRLRLHTEVDTPLQVVNVSRSDLFQVLLGLSVSRGLVQAMGGRIEVQTELQRGSTFTVVYPLEPPDMSGERAAGVNADKEQKDDDYATTHSHC